MNTRSNHPNSGHRTSAVTKQFFRIRGEALIRWVGNADDWALARGSGSERGSKPVLQCPDEGCGQKLDSVERTKPRLTRFLRDAHGTSCSHFIPPGGAGRMTNEHMWLQGVVRDLCEQLGYSARLEVDLADVKVESPVPYAVEVQRVSTNFAKRTAQRRANGMKSLWLLPETEKQRDIGRNGMRHDDPLFKHPAVRLRYYWSGRNHKTMVPTQYLNREVWNAGATDKVDLYVAVTLWTLADDRSRFDRSSSMPLRGFLNEVLSGRLEWFTKEQLHGTSNDKRSKWAGWANPEDVQQVVGLRQLKRLEDRRTADAARRRTFEAKKRREDESESRSPFVEMAPSPVESDASVGSTQRSETPVQPFEKRPGECLGSSDSDYRQGPSAGKQAKLDSRCSRQALWRRFLSFLGF